jgi:hypothetical protein
LDKQAEKIISSNFSQNNGVFPYLFRMSFGREKNRVAPTKRVDLTNSGVSFG